MAQKGNERLRAEKKYKGKKEGFKLLIKELLSNAFHAVILNKESDVNDIYLNTSVKKDDNGVYTRVEIEQTDTGCGFLEEDKEYFVNLDTPNPRKTKAKLASKGEGRLALCYFTDYTTFETAYRDDDHLYNRKFEYPKRGDDLFRFDEPFPLEDENIQTGTTVKSVITAQNKLSSAKTFFDNGWEEWILEAFFPYLIKDDLNLYVNDEIMKISESYHDRDFSLKIDGHSNEFKTFFISHKSEITKDGVDVYYIGENMVLEKREYKLDWSVPYTKVLVSSDFFDSRIDPAGVEIELDDGDKAAINAQINKVCEDHFKSTLEDIRQKNKDTVNNVSNENPFLVGLIEYQDEHKEYEKDKLYDDAYIKLGKQQRKILEATELSENQFNKAEELASRNLMQYVLM